MRITILLAIVLLSFTTCRKEGRMCCMPPIDPPFPTLIASDTITQGNFWNFNIGDQAEATYLKIQQTGPMPSVKYIGVISNTYTRLEDVETKFPLYRELMLRDGNVPEAVGIAFENNKVSGVFTSGKGMVKAWPSLLDRNRIRKGDAIETVYQKLVAIRAKEKYTRFFSSITLTSKDVAKGYEAGMAASTKWQLNVVDIGNRNWLVDLNFSSGILTSVSYMYLQNQ